MFTLQVTVMRKPENFASYVRHVVRKRLGWGITVACTCAFEQFCHFSLTLPLSLLFRKLSNNISETLQSPAILGLRAVFSGSRCEQVTFKCSNWYKQKPRKVSFEIGKIEQLTLIQCSYKTFLVLNCLPLPATFLPHILLSSEVL